MGGDAGREAPDGRIADVLVAAVQPAATGSMAGVRGGARDKKACVWKAGNERCDMAATWMTAGRQSKNTLASVTSTGLVTDKCRL